MCSHDKSIPGVFYSRNIFLSYDEKHFLYMTYHRSLILSFDGNVLID